MELNERRRQIMEVLSEREYVTVEELSKTLNVSLVTIRTDLTALENDCLLIRTHGGAMKTEKRTTRFLSTTMGEYEAEKTAIAKAASRFIKQGSTIIIDSGSTTIRMLDHVKDKGITVVTNSVPAIERLKDDESVELFTLGGNLRRASMATIGPMAKASIALINADIYFMGATAFNQDTITCTNILEAELKNAMAKAADKVIFLADSSKWGKKSFATICNWSNIDVFVTDTIEEDFRQRLEDMGIEVIVTGK